MDLISTIHLVAPKKIISTIDSKKPLNLTYKRIFFFLFITFWLSPNIRLPEGKGVALAQAWHYFVFKFVVEARSSGGSRS